MKKQNEYSKICRELNKRAKANIRRFISWIDEGGAFKAANEDIGEIARTLESLADKLTNPEKVEAFFKAEEMKPGLLMFVPFFLTKQDGAEMVINYGKERKASKGKKGGGARLV